MQRLAQSDEANLCLAFTSMCSQYGVIELISDFAGLHPEYNVQIIEGFRVSDLILGNRCDFAFANDAVHIDDRLDKIVYKVDSLALYMNREDPLAGLDEIPLSMLEGRRLIAHSRSNGAYHLDTLNFQAACRKEGFEPDFSSSVSYTSSIMKLIKNGQGIVALYCGQIPEDQLDPDVAAVPLVPTIESTVYLLYNRKHKRTAARKEFMNYLISQ